MKKTYTKKQITEAIAYWKKQLNEQQGQDNFLYAIEKVKTQIKDIRAKYQILEEDFNNKYSSDEDMKNKLYSLYDSIENIAQQFGLTF